MINWLNILGIIFSFIGAISLAIGLFINKKEAIRLGVSRASGETDEEKLKLPAVQDRLKQRKYGIIGAILLFIGFILQLLEQFL
jgi:hypothetical protein